MKNQKNVKFPLNNMENFPEGLNFALSERLEIHPCVPKDIGSFGPLPSSLTLQLITPSSALGTADHVRSLDD